MYMSWEDVKNIANPDVRDELIKFYCMNHKEEVGSQYIHYKKMSNGHISWTPQVVEIRTTPLVKRTFSRKTREYLDNYFSKKEKVNQAIFDELMSLIA